jgi:hypothetical protein
MTRCCGGGQAFELESARFRKRFAGHFNQYFLTVFVLGMHENARSRTPHWLGRSRPFGLKRRFPAFPSCRTAGAGREPSERSQLLMNLREGLAVPCGHPADPLRKCRDLTPELEK